MLSSGRGGGGSSCEIIKTLTFDGSNDYISTPDVMQYALDGSSVFQGLTIMFRADFGSVGSWERVVEFTRPSDNNILIHRYGTSSDITYTVVRGTSVNRLSASGAITSGIHHYAITHSSAGTAKIYKDGVLISSGSISTPYDLERTINYIGRSASSGDSYFDSKISDLQIYGRELSGSEVADIASNEGSASGIAAWYKLDVDASDSSGNDLDATLQNGLSFVIDDVVCTGGGSDTVTLGGSNRSIQFNNSSAMGGSSNFVYTSAGYVGIGTDSPTAALHVVGDINFTGIMTDISDRNAKEKITPLNDQLKLINSLQGVSFVMKGETNTELGLIAQDVERYYPLVGYDTF